MKNVDFSYRVFISSLMFFLAKCIDSRDFPIQGIPLVYPAFILYILLITDLKKIFIGILRTKFLIILVSVLWVYHAILKICLGMNFSIVSIALLFEPIMLFVVAGVAASNDGGKKAVIWAFILAVICSTLFGFGTIFIGSPFLEINEILHSTLIANKSTLDKLHRITIGNAGFSLFIFKFAYQLATAFVMVFALLVDSSTSKKAKTSLYMAIVVLIAGILSNGERSILVSVFIGIITMNFLKRELLISFRMVMVLIFTMFVVWIKLNYFQDVSGLDSLGNRMNFGLEEFARVKAAFVAICSVLSEPFGAGGMSDVYISFAKKNHFTNSMGTIYPPHNNFASTIMETGIVGLIVVFLYLFFIIKTLFLIRKGNTSYPLEIIIATGCITAMLNSFAHNVGFFTKEMCICFTSGYLCAFQSENKKNLGQRGTR
ncbi:MAG: hypothetical protein GY737_25925 [Desulfobacteraceae bacterium]|nr:hypothetical protein [Desulfobacteraceae bacterium]